MNQPFKVVSLTHTKAPLAIREVLALAEPACRQLLCTLRDEWALRDVLVLSTCNRTEIYYSAGQDLSPSIISVLCRQKGIADGARYAAYFTAITDAELAARHLLEVAMGLDAQVVGDQQISHQVKQAYQWSVDADAAGPFLHRLLHTAFFTHKRVEQETAFRDGAASTSYATLELVERLTGHLAAPRILIVGLGDIGTEVGRHFGSSRRFSHVTVTNRTRAKADELARAYGFEVLDFADLAQGIQAADVVVSSLAAPVPGITRELVGQLTVLSHKFFVDLSVPRSIEAAVEDVPGILLYTLDNVQSATSVVLERRLAAIPQVRLIIEESLAGLREWAEDALVSPTIQKLKNALEQLRQEELGRVRKRISPEEADLVDEITRSFVQKVLKQPVLQLKAACKRGETGPMMELLAVLFDLESQPAVPVA